MLVRRKRNLAESVVVILKILAVHLYVVYGRFQQSLVFGGIFCVTLSGGFL